MASITLGALRDYWKRVYDAITGPTGSAAPTYAMQVGGSDGTNLRALKTDTSGNLSVTLYGSNVTTLIPANAVEIRDTNTKTYSVSLNGKIPLIIISSSLNVTCQVRLKVEGMDYLTPAIYNELEVLPANTGRLIFGPYSGGAGVESGYKSVPALANYIEVLYILVNATSAPTAGSLTITVKAGVH